MPRKPTGRPRGRPKGALLYRVPDHLLLEIARSTGGDPAKEPAAARAVAKRIDGPVVSAQSKVKRILRQYRSRRNWFLLRVKAPATPLRTAPLIGYTGAVQAFLKEQQHFARLAQIIAKNPLAEAARQLQEQQRAMDDLARLITRNPLAEAARQLQEQQREQQRVRDALVQAVRINVPTGYI